jgi:SAM-dependent MidA family methyltransferase
LQALKAHAFADPLAEPGLADLTAHVDFAALARAATSAGAAVHGPVTQGRFLQRLGIEERSEALRKRASDAQAKAIDAAVARLTGTDAQGMGDLFKVIAVAHPQLRQPAGFA